MKKLQGIVQVLFTVLLLVGVYTETGPFTVITMAIVIISLELSAKLHVKRIHICEAIHGMEDKND